MTQDPSSVRNPFSSRSAKADALRQRDGSSIELPRRTPWKYRWFAAYSKRYLGRHFHSVRLSLAQHSRIDPEAPLIVYLNHASWWDPLTCLVLHQTLFPDRVGYAPIDARQLERYRIFCGLGFFGVDPRSARGGVRFLRTADAILQQPRSVLWLTPQGRFCDVRERPVVVLPGLAHLALRHPSAQLLPLALEYLFWQDRLPEVLARLGPIRLGREVSAASSLDDMRDALGRLLAEVQDGLSAESQQQFACHQLAQQASFEWLLFLDADVRVSSNVLREVVDLAVDEHLNLLSGVPRQETGSLLERLLIPLIHFVLLGFLPIRRMRRSGSESYAAGCGQLFLARRSAYQAADGHASIKASLHDGLQLPCAFRRAGFQTDLFDATGAARCRMYRSSGETWRGLGKNAIEGLASLRLIVPATGMLLLGQVLPFALVALSCCQGGPLNLIALIGLFCATVSRSMLAIRFHQSCIGVLLHPLSVFLLCLIQWDALWRFWKGQPSEWKGRSYPGLPSVLPPG